MLESITLIDPTAFIMDIPSTTVPRVMATFEAIELLEIIRRAHGPLVIHQSGGCCDGSQPMSFLKEEFRLGGQDVRVGTIDGTEYWMHGEQFAYWKHCQLTLDVVVGRGSSFSLEIPYGKRFIIRSRIFTDAELERLEPVVQGG
jgi:hypothetical protein